MSHGTIRAVAALLLTAVCILSGCDKVLDSAGPKLASSATQATPVRFSMPQSWPLGEIVPPSGALKAVRPYPVEEGYGDEFYVAGSPFNNGSEHSGRMWSVGFSYKKGVNAAMSHFDRCVRPLSWKLYYDQPATREYISPDSQYITQLHWDGDENVYMLSIFLYDKALEGVQFDGA